MFAPLHVRTNEGTLEQPRGRLYWCMFCSARACERAETMKRV